MLFACALTADAVPSSTPSQSEQYLLEQLLRDVDTVQKFKDQQNNYLPIAAWDGVEMGPSGRVERILWYKFRGYFAQNGVIDLRFVPPHVVEINVERNSLRGSVETASLPRCLEILALAQNKLHCSFRIADLPQTIHEVYIDSNDLSGELALQALPKGVTKFSASSNGFVGVLDCTQLPPKLDSLFLDKNRFLGPIDLSTLPHTLEFFYLSENEIYQGVLTIDPLPRYISIDVEKFDDVRRKDGTAIPREKLSC